MQRLPSDTEKTSGYSTDSSISSLGRIRRRAGRRVQRARKNSEASRMSELSRFDSGSEFSLSEFSEMSLSESDRSESRAPSSLSTSSKRTRRGKRGGKRHQKETVKKFEPKKLEKESFINEWVRKTTNDQSNEIRSSLDDVIEEGINDDDMEIDDVTMTSQSTSGSGSVCSDRKTGSDTGNSAFDSLTTGSDDLDWAEEMVEDDHREPEPVKKLSNRPGTPLPEENEIETSFVSLSRPVSRQTPKPSVDLPVELPVLPVSASYAGAAKRISDSERMEIINRKLIKMKEEQKMAEEEKRSRSNSKIGHVVIGRRDRKNNR